MKAKEIINWVVYFVCLLAVVFVINTFVVQRTMVSGDSMYPYLHNKDQLMMDKLSYRFHDPERFDIVVFPVVRDGKEEYYTTCDRSAGRNRTDHRWLCLHQR